MIEGLTQGRVYTGTVLSIKEAADSFLKKGGQGGKSWCHLLKIIVFGFEQFEPLDAQICMDYQNLDLFGVDDDIKFNISHLTDKTSTIQFKQIAKTAISKKPGYKPPTAEEVFDPTKSYDPLSAPHITIVTGTVVDRSVNAAAHLFQYKNVSDDDFFKMCDKMRDYYKKNLV